MFTRYLVFALSIFVMVHADCVVYDNFYTYSAPVPGRTDIVTINFISARQRTGWFAVAFTRNKTMENSLLFVSYLNSTGTSLYQMQFNGLVETSKPVDTEIISNKLVYDTNFEQAFNIFRFSFDINVTALNGTNSVFFAASPPDMTPITAPIGNSTLVAPAKSGFRPVLDMEYGIST
jgi:hypothetical protein